jgi:hypothetical protein
MPTRITDGGELVNRLRAERGLSLRVLQLTSGITRRALLNAIQGKAKSTPQTVRRLQTLYYDLAPKANKRNIPAPAYADAPPLIIPARQPADKPPVRERPASAPARTRTARQRPRRPASIHPAALLVAGLFNKQPEPEPEPPARPAWPAQLADLARRPRGR